MSSQFSSDHPADAALSPQIQIPDTATTIRLASSNLLAALFGAYVLFKALEILGFPVWLWLHHILKMASDISPENLAVVLFNKQPSGSDPDQDTQNSHTSGRAGGALSGMFGLSSGGILGKGLSGVTGALSKNYRNVPAGLGNWDNSCYQNSVIQGLSSLPALREYLSRTTTEYKALDVETTNGALFEMINKLNSPKNHGQNFWIRGKLKSMSTFQQQDAQEYYSKILDELDKEVKNASNSRRRSSASWLSTVASLGDVPAANPEKEESKKEDIAVEETDDSTQAPPEQPRIVPNPLDGLLAQRVGCINCGYTEGLSLIPFNCITVPLGRSWAYDVRSCLDEYTNLELISGVECAKCTLLKMEKTTAKLATAQPSTFGPRLQAIKDVLEEEDYEDKTLIKKLGLSKKVWVQSTKSRQAVIARAPKSLVLHVNRSIFDEMTGAQYKNNANVLYPKTLDLGTWCLGNRPSGSEKPDESIEESWPRDPTKSMLGESQSQVENEEVEGDGESPFRYELRAAITHFGNHGNGHYVCYRRLPFGALRKQDVMRDEEAEDVEEGEIRVEKEEEVVQEEVEMKEQWWRLSDENVYEIQEEEALRQQNVFMLFYERVDAGAAPALPVDAQPMPSGVYAAAESSIPLPPLAGHLDTAIFDHTAVDVPLPAEDDDDDDLDIVPLRTSSELSETAGKSTSADTDIQDPDSTAESTTSADRTITAPSDSIDLAPSTTTTISKESDASPPTTTPTTAQASSPIPEILSTSTSSSSSSSSAFSKDQQQTFNNSNPNHTPLQPHSSPSPSPSPPPASKPPLEKQKTKKAKPTRGVNKMRTATDVSSVTSKRERESREGLTLVSAL